MTVQAYTTKLQAGLGLIPETEKLLQLWEPDMSSRALIDRALDNGDFPTMTARRLRNIISEGFAPRYLVNDAQPATVLKAMQHFLSEDDRKQLYFLFTTRANPILADFVRDIYWPQYTAGAMTLTKIDALDFVEDAVAEGKTTTAWSESTKTRVSSYILGACADFGLLGRMETGGRKIEFFRPSNVIANYLAHELHFSGLG
ncbi:MAG: BrxA family protein, partial [Paracoccaceae bacterium]